jgi:hypothetical protein
MISEPSVDGYLQDINLPNICTFHTPVVQYESKLYAPVRDISCYVILYTNGLMKFQ